MSSPVDSMPTVGGGMVVGSFTHASTDGQGWKVIDILGDVSTSVLESARNKIPRLVADESRRTASPPATRPRTVAWLSLAQGNVLINTIHAGDDDSQRPDNNFTVGLVVVPAVGRGDRPTGLRPTELIDLALWPAPWGPVQVREFSLQNWFGALTSHRGYTLKGEHMDVGAIVERIARRPHGPEQLRTLFGAIVSALHEPNRQVRVWADNVDIASAFLEVAFALMPEGYCWKATFELSTRKMSYGPDRSRSPEMPMIVIGRRPRTAESPQAQGIVDLNADSQIGRSDEGIPGFCAGREYLLSVDQALGQLQQQPVGARDVIGLLQLLGASSNECVCMQAGQSVGAAKSPTQTSEQGLPVGLPNPPGLRALDTKSIELLNRFDLAMQLLDAYADSFRRRLMQQPGSRDAPDQLSREFDRVLSHISSNWLATDGIGTMSSTLTKIKELP